MFKKTLLATAIMATVAAPAFADVVITPKAADFTTTTLASVTKQPVLSYSTAEQDVTVQFTTTGDIKKNGFITLEIEGDATFNSAEVRQWLTVDSNNELVEVAGLTINGVTVSVTNAIAALPSDVVIAGIGADGYPRLTNDTGNLVGFDGATTSDLGGADYSALAQAEQALADAAKAAIDTVVASNGTVTGGTTATVTEMDKFFQIEGSAISHSIDLDGKRLRLALKNAGALDEVLASADGDAKTAYRAGTNVVFGLSKANQIFNLKSGSSSSVSVKVGALRNASYTADPKGTAALFQLGDLFALKSANTDGKALTDTALVSKRFAQLQGGNGDIDSKFNFLNTTTNQNIQLNKVTLSVEGDFTGFSQDNAGNLLDSAGTATGWKVANGVATKLVGDTVLEGNVNLNAQAPGPLSFLLNVAAANEDAIVGQTFAVKATILGADQDTFENFTSNLLDVVVIDRDGMKFDTITTGTSAANQIFVRDISKKLPETGGKIFVTITEYDQHGVNGRGEGNTLIERAELSTTLPSGGAVTLSPADVAAEVGVTTTPGRQARFVFEVETNQGEVAVKKSNSEGVDIKNGTKGVEIQKGGNVVDFTL